MKVKELREYLNKLSVHYDDSDVILQKDSEGNGYSPLAGIDSYAVYLPDTTWSGDVFSLAWSADECCMTEDEWIQMRKNKHCVVLSPTN